MLIFNTIFDPTGRNWGDQIIYWHFKNVCMGKISLQNIMYIIWVASFFLLLQIHIFLPFFFSFQHLFTLNSTMLVLYKDQNRKVTLFLWLKHAKWKNLYNFVTIYWLVIDKNSFFNTNRNTCAEPYRPRKISQNCFLD